MKIIFTPRRIGQHHSHHDADAQHHAGRLLAVDELLHGHDDAALDFTVVLSCHSCYLIVLRAQRYAFGGISAKKHYLCRRYRHIDRKLTVRRLPGAHTDGRRHPHHKQGRRRPLRLFLCRTPLAQTARADPQRPRARHPATLGQGSLQRRGGRSALHRCQHREISQEEHIREATRSKHH